MRIDCCFSPDSRLSVPHLMPLIIISGPPLSRKTELANLIKAKLSDLNVVIINEEYLCINKSGLYSDAKREKIQRGEILSAVERFLNQSDLVIADSLNYIKGFRYQMTCVAKSLKTPFVVLNVMCDLQSSLENQSEGYTEKEIRDLYQRFEEPALRNKWESPILNVVAHEVDIFDCDKLRLLLQGKISSKISTESKPLQESDYLHAIDNLIKSGLKVIMDAQKEGRFRIKWEKSEKEIICSKKMNLIESRKLHLQFLKLAKTLKSHDLQNVADAFVGYINTWSQA